VITEKDLQEAIAECQGERNPNANTCIKLAAFYTIRNELFGNSGKFPTVAESATLPAYSYAAPPEQSETTIDYQSDTEFSAVIDGRRAGDVWPVMEELMEVLRRTNKPLYNATIRKIQD
jgi:hypothetical protein